VYRLQLALGAAGLAACALVLAAGVRAVHVHPAAAHRLDVAGVQLTYPAVNTAAMVLLALAALGAAVLVVAARAAWGQARAHRRMLRSLPVTGPLRGHPAVLLVDTTAPLAFCAGWLRPRVYISRGVVARLSERELGAVVAHEQHHGVLRDPLRLAASHVLCQALFFLPALRRLHATYADAAEVTADAAAAEAVRGGPATLASALLAVGSTYGGGVTGVSARRVDALLGRPVSWRPPRLPALAGIVTLVLLVSLVWRASAAASVQASLNLPIASSQPCVLVLALVPVLVVLSAALLRRAPHAG
jgi:Zn-dependent protease with chaperone function